MYSCLSNDDLTQFIRRRFANPNKPIRRDIHHFYPKFLRWVFSCFTID